MKRNRSLTFDRLESIVSLSDLGPPLIDDSEFDNPVPPLIVDTTVFVPPVGIIPVDMPGPSPTPIFIGPLPATPLPIPDVPGDNVPPDVNLSPS